VDDGIALRRFAIYSDNLALTPGTRLDVDGIITPIGGGTDSGGLEPDRALKQRLLTK